MKRILDTMSDRWVRMGVEERDPPEKEPGSDSENRVENVTVLGAEVTMGDPFGSNVEARIMRHFHEVREGTGMRPRWCQFLLNTANWGSEMGLALDSLPEVLCDLRQSPDPLWASVFISEPWKGLDWALGS